MGARWALGGAALVMGLAATRSGLEAVTGRSPGGPASSSYATGDDGLAAYADLLAARGHPVARLRSDLGGARLDPHETVVVAEPPELGSEATAALGRFVRRGGRVVATGPGAAAALRGVIGDQLAWSGQEVVDAAPLTPVAEVAPVRAVRSAGAGSWRDVGATLPALGGPQGALATVASVGRGRVVAVADTSVWHNRFLAQADNAAFGLAAVGEQGRPVRFAEAHHGYGGGQGVAAIPSRWKWALSGLASAVLVWMWSVGRRLGPPQVREREAPPPRRAYVDALAGSLARTRQPAAAAEPLVAAGRSRLARHGALPPDAGEEELRRVARRLGLSDEEADALLRPAGDKRSLLAAGRAVAHLEGGRW